MSLLSDLVKLLITHEYSNITAFIVTLATLIPFIKSIIKILGMTAIEQLLTPRKEKAFNLSLGKVYISFFIIFYFNLFGYLMSDFFTESFIIYSILIVLVLFIIMALFIVVAYLLKKVIMWQFSILLISFVFLILSIHIYLFIELPKFFFTELDDGYISFTIFYIFVFWLLMVFNKRILNDNNETKYRVKFIDTQEINQVLENKAFHHAINKNVYVYTKHHTKSIMNEFYVYYVAEDKLMIYFNEQSNLYLHRFD